MYRQSLPQDLPHVHAEFNVKSKKKRQTLHVTKLINRERATSETLCADQ